MFWPRRVYTILALLPVLHLVTGQNIHLSTLLAQQAVPTVISSSLAESGNGGVVGVVVLPGLTGQPTTNRYPYADPVLKDEATAQTLPLEPVSGINPPSINPPVLLPQPQAPPVRLATTSQHSIPSSASLPVAPPAFDLPSTDPNSALANVNTLPFAPSQYQVPTTGILTTASGKPIPCSPKNTHLNPTTHKLISECTESTFCLAPPGSPPNATGNGVCARRRCRRDMYPFGFFGTEGSVAASSATNLASLGKKKKKKNPATKTGPALPDGLPPICADGTFCPDDGSGCLPQVSLGAACELARDEQCSMPPNLVDSISLTAIDGKPERPIPSRPRAICLDRTCMSASQSLSEPCVLENTTYVSEIDKGQAGSGLFVANIIRDNCLSPTYYCSLEGVSSPLTKAKMAPPIGGFAGTGKNKLIENGVFVGKGTCKRTKLLGEQCSWDAMCETHNCDPTLGTCVLPPETPIHIAPWQWLLTSFCVFAAIIVTCVLLSVIHRRNQEDQYRELVEYYEEQSGLRRSLTALYAAAGYFHMEGNSTLNTGTVDASYEKTRRGSLYYHD